MPSRSRSKTLTRDPNWLGPAILPGEILLKEFPEAEELGQVETARSGDDTRGHGVLMVQVKGI